MGRKQKLKVWSLKSEVYKGGLFSEGIFTSVLNLNFLTSVWNVEDNSHFAHFFEDLKWNIKIPSMTKSPSRNCFLITYLNQIFVHYNCRWTNLSLQKEILGSWKYNGFFWQRSSLEHIMLFSSIIVSPLNWKSKNLCKMHYITSFSFNNLIYVYFNWWSFCENLSTKQLVLHWLKVKWWVGKLICSSRFFDPP